MISVDEISRQVADLCPEDHLKAFLKRDTRPDGRSLEEFRPIIIAPNVLNRLVFSFWFRIPTVKLKIPGKSMGKSGYRTSVTFKL